MAGAEQNKSTQHQFTMPGFEGEVVQTVQKKKGRSFMDRLLGRQEEVIWSEPDPIESVPPGRQQGFFESESGELHLRPQSGDRMIKDPVPKKPRKRKGDSAYARVMAHDQAIRDNEDQVGDHMYETTSGGVKKVEVTRHGIRSSPSGEAGPLFRHTRPKTTPVPKLGPREHALKRALDAKEATRVAALRGRQPSSAPSEPLSTFQSEHHVSGLPSLTEPGVKIDTLEEMARRVLEVLSGKKTEGR